MPRARPAPHIEPAGAAPPGGRTAQPRAGAAITGAGGGRPAGLLQAGGWEGRGCDSTPRKNGSDTCESSYSASC